jgi:secretion/DNA translocation related TadE-like protein
LCLLAVAVLTYGDIVRTRHRAVAAADLAALAGAAYAEYGEAAACDRARWVATGMHVDVTGCRLSRWDALVEIAAELPDGFGTLTAHSRAGPSR